MMTIVLYLLFILCCIAEGAAQGVAYHIRNFNTKLKFNEHIIYTFMRIFYASGFVIAFALQLNKHEFKLDLQYLFFAVALLAVHPFFHLGAMYQMRKYLSGGSVYPGGWMDDPSPLTHGTNKLTIYFEERVIALCVSIAIIILQLQFDDWCR